jgi:O-antigen/teichoic acid export membrane protein
MRNSSTITVLSHFVTATIVGAYSIGFAALSLVAMLSWSLDFAIAPYYYRWRKGEIDWHSNVRDTLSVMNGLVFIVASVGILLYADIRSAFFGTKFSDADQVAPLLLIAGMLQPLYFMTVKPYFYLKRTAILSSITFTTSAIAVIGTVLAVRQFGYLAAAAMTVVSYGGVVVISYWFSLRLEPSPFKLYRRLAPALICGGLTAAVYAFDLPLTARIVIAALLVMVAFQQVVKAFRALQIRHAFQI